MKQLSNKTAIVTGGTRGIGKAIVSKFIEQGCNVAFTFHSSNKEAKKLEKKFSNSSVACKGYKSNAANFSESLNLIENVTKDFEKVDILVNNAGITRDGLIKNE